MSDVYGAALMPMRDDLSCDGRRLAAHCRDLMARGCKGVALFGTTGEGPSLSLAEKVGVLEELEGVDLKRVIVANGSAGIFDTVELARAAVGCKALLICPPSFYKNVTDAGVVAYYREVLKRISGTPVLLYHIPQYSGVPISLEVIRVLREEFPEQVVGIKESEGKLAFVKEILAAFPGFQVFVAKETQIVEALSLGAKGVICGFASIFPELICKLEKNSEELETVCKAVQGLPFIPAAKAFMERGGESWPVRPPLMPLDEGQRRKFLSYFEGRVR